MEINIQAHGHSQNSSAQSEQQHSRNGKHQRGKKGDKSVKAKQLGQQCPVVQTPSVVSSSKHPSPHIAGPSTTVFIGATSNSVDTPVQCLQQSHQCILQKMEYEEKFPSLPPTKKIAQSTSSPLVRQSN
jgi:hypothetical protein